MWFTFNPNYKPSADVLFSLGSVGNPTLLDPIEFIGTLVADFLLTIGSSSSICCPESSLSSSGIVTPAVDLKSTADLKPFSDVRMCCVSCEKDT